MEKKYLQLNNISALTPNPCIFDGLNKLPKEINGLIKFTNEKLTI